MGATSLKVTACRSAACTSPSANPITNTKEYVRALLSIRAFIPDPLRLELECGSRSHDPRIQRRRRPPERRAVGLIDCPNNRRIQRVERLEIDVELIGADRECTTQGQVELSPPFVEHRARL